MNDLTFSDPNPVQLACYVSHILSEVQGLKRQRLVLNPDLSRVFDEPEGSFEVNGGRPASGQAQTTRLGLAWFTDSEGHRHVRVYCDRVLCSCFCVPCLFFGTCCLLAPETLVFPDDLDHTCRWCYALTDIKNAAHWDGEQFVCLPCHHSRRYYQETGFLPPGRGNTLEFIGTPGIIGLWTSGTGGVLRR